MGRRWESAVNIRWVREQTRGALRVRGGPSKRAVGIWRPVRLGGVNRAGRPQLPLGVGGYWKSGRQMEIEKGLLRPC